MNGPYNILYRYKVKNAEELVKYLKKKHIDEALWKLSYTAWLKKYWIPSSLLTNIKNRQSLVSPKTVQKFEKVLWKDIDKFFSKVKIEI